MECTPRRFITAQWNNINLTTPGCRVGSTDLNARDRGDNDFIILVIYIKYIIIIIYIL